ncbi:hypothetical protein GCM10025331_43800 [Actinoplanes utahensis]
MIAEPPSDSGACQRIVTVPTPPVAVTARGAAGTVAPGAAREARRCRAAPARSAPRPTAGASMRTPPSSRVVASARLTVASPLVTRSNPVARAPDAVVDCARNQAPGRYRVTKLRTGTPFASSCGFPSTPRLSGGCPSGS